MGLRDPFPAEEHGAVRCTGQVSRAFHSVNTRYGSMNNKNDGGSLTTGTNPSVYLILVRQRRTEIIEVHLAPMSGRQVMVSVRMSPVLSPVRQHTCKILALARPRVLRVAGLFHGWMVAFGNVFIQVLAQSLDKDMVERWIFLRLLTVRVEKCSQTAAK